MQRHHLRRSFQADRRRWRSPAGTAAPAVAPVWSSDPSRPGHDLGPESSRRGWSGCALRGLTERGRYPPRRRDSYRSQRGCVFLKACCKWKVCEGGKAAAEPVVVLSTTWSLKLYADFFELSFGASSPAELTSSTVETRLYALASVTDISRAEVTKWLSYKVMEWFLSHCPSYML